MLTLPMVGGSRLRLADIDLDPSGIKRSATDLATRDLPALVRRADVPARLETGMDAASDAIRTAVEQIPGQRRRTKWRPWMPGLALVSVLAMVAITGWWMARAAAREVERELDEDALDRAADEGMSGEPEIMHVSHDPGPNGTTPATIATATIPTATIPEPTAAEFGRAFPA